MKAVSGVMVSRKLQVRIIVMANNKARNMLRLRMARVVNTTFIVKVGYLIRELSLYQFIVRN